MRKSSLNALFPKTRLAVLRACVLQPEKWWYLSDLAKFLKVGPSSLQRELASLSEAGLLEVKREGNRVYYKANTTWPGHKEIQMLLVKTVGIADVVRTVLKKFLNNIDVAFIYGSYARGEAIAESDIDLMIIGDASLSDLSPFLRKAEATLSREINPTLFSRREFISKVQASDGFLQTVLDDKRILIKGNEDELKSMVG